MESSQNDISLPADMGKVESDGSAQVLLLHKQLLPRRLYIQSVVRFFVASGIIVAALVAKYVIRVEGLDVPRLIVLAILLGLFNLGSFVAARRHRDFVWVVSSYRFLQGVMHVTISVDFLFLTAGLWLVGGARSPLQAFYLVHVILAAILLSPKVTCAHALFGYSLLSALVLGEWSGILPVHLPVGAVNSAEPLDGRFALAVLVVQGFLMGLVVFLVTGLTRLLREGERHLRTANTRLERVSDMHRDFLHIALHDLKSPVSAATMLLHSLEAGVKPPLTDEQKLWVERVRLRLNEVTVFLSDLEALTTLESVDVSKYGEPTDMRALLRHVVEENQDLAVMHHHTVSVDVEGEVPEVFGVKRLLHEAVVNLVTNAIKYTPDNGAISVRGRHKDGVFRIEVEDNGIGIAREHQKRLFGEFARIRRTDTPLGKVTGSGLGLSIVRRIAKVHGGRVGVTSDLNEGSTFFIEMPVQPKHADQG